MPKTKRERLFIKNLVEKIGYSRRWIYTNMNNNTLPFPWYFYGPGKRFAYSDDVDNYLKNREVKGGIVKSKSAVSRQAFPAEKVERRRS